MQRLRVWVSICVLNCAVLEVGFEFVLLLCEEVVLIHPFSTNLTQTTAQTSAETDVVSYCGPEVLRLQIQQIIKIRQYFQQRLCRISRYLKWRVENIFGQQWYKFSKIHVWFIHEKLLSNDVFLLLAHLFIRVVLIPVFVFIFAHIFWLVFFIKKRILISEI